MIIVTKHNIIEQKTTIRAFDNTQAEVQQELIKEFTNGGTELQGTTLEEQWEDLKEVQFDIFDTVLEVHQVL